MKRTFYLMCLFMCMFTIEAEAQAPEGIDSFKLDWIPFENVQTYDITLDKDIQLYAIKNCSDFGIDVAIFFALMEHETENTFDADIISKTNDLGLCQLQKKYIKYHCEMVGFNPCTFDAFNPYDSIALSVRILSDLRQEYSKYYEGVDLTTICLSAYNRGITAMKNRKSIETEYASKIIKLSAKYRR